MNNTRALIISFFVLIAFIGLVVKLFYVQVGQHTAYKAKADQQQNSIHTVKAERGIIFDRNKEIMAYTKDDVSLFADARMLNKRPKNKLKVAKELAKIFNTDENKYLKMISGSKGNICLERKIPKDKSLLLNNFIVDGFFKVEDYTRVYPYKNITSHILGYVDKQSEGLAGLEKLFNQRLKGEDGELHIENDAIGHTVSINYDESVAPVPGYSFMLTIDKVYQKILVTELTEGVKLYNAKSGIGIIANPQTGEILAMANVPDYDPNEYNKFDDFARRNRALTDTYEPGSTMKSVVLSILLNDNIVNENDLINTENGRYKIRGALISDTHEFSSLTVRGVLEQSSNIGMVKLSEKIDNNDFYKGLRDFGFGNLTSIDMLGETRGNLKKPNQFSKISKAFMAHGYEISVTPIQMVMAYSAIINGGNLYQPYILKKIISPNGSVDEEFEPNKIRNVISEETSQKMKDIMLGVVEKGTGSNARQDNIYVGGKTGTAQKLVNGRYSSWEYNSSFIGFFPVENPKVICFILLDAPQVGRYGGQAAAPIFKNITTKILETDFSIPRNKNKIERNELMQNLMAEVNISDERDEQISFANVSNVKTEKKIDTKINKSVMPNLTNKTIREAVSILSGLNIKYSIEGYGRIVSQTVKPGSRISSKTECKLTGSTSNAGND
ncbi:MAG: PASTA domain-containing protein [Ignavibacteriales bacterium]|jgi:cell division protein FtsI (penicillin-binding protein 3)|nr:PASTA domain-containing protein [Ignavibacteriales bacterium]MBK7981479.1 PASTA domain-containing protein [Ignavibacteriota bacterium]